MILPDSAVWIDHLRRPEQRLDELLANDEVLGHAFVTGEVSLGSIAQRARVLHRLNTLPQIAIAGQSEVTQLIETHELWSKGVGYVDVALLTSVVLRPGTRLWTRDKDLRRVAERLDLAAPLS